jgi:hypothetical protein
VQRVTAAYSDGDALIASLLLKDGTIYDAYAVVERTAERRRSFFA